MIGYKSESFSLFPKAGFDPRSMRAALGLGRCHWEESSRLSTLVRTAFIDLSFDMQLSEGAPQEAFVEFFIPPPPQPHAEAGEGALQDSFPFFIFLDPDPSAL